MRTAEPRCALDCSFVGLFPGAASLDAGAAPRAPSLRFAWRRANGRQVWHNLVNGPSLRQRSHPREVRRRLRAPLLRMPPFRDGPCLSGHQPDLRVRLGLVLPPAEPQALPQRRATGRHRPGETAREGAPVGGWVALILPSGKSSAGSGCFRRLNQERVADFSPSPAPETLHLLVRTLSCGIPSGGRWRAVRRGTLRCLHRSPGCVLGPRPAVAAALAERGQVGSERRPGRLAAPG